MNKEEFANLLEGFDFNIIEEYWLRVKSSDNISFQLVNGFEKELDRLDQLEERIDKAIKYIDHEINCIQAIINSTNDITTRNYYIDRMQPYIDIKYLLVKGSEDHE